MDLRNVGIPPQCYAASWLRWPRPESSRPWKPQISQPNNCFKIVPQGGAAATRSAGTTCCWLK